MTSPLHTYTLKYRSHMGHEYETEMQSREISVVKVWHEAVLTALEEIHLHNEVDDLLSLEIR